MAGTLCDGGCSPAVFLSMAVAVAVAAAGVRRYQHGGSDPCFFLSCAISLPLTFPRSPPPPLAGWLSFRTSMAAATSGISRTSTACVATTTVASSASSSTTTTQGIWSEFLCTSAISLSNELVIAWDPEIGRTNTSDHKK